MTTQGEPSSAQDLLEFCVAYVLILAAIWTLNPWQRWFYWVAITWIVVTTCMHRPTWKALGLGLAGPGPVAVGGGRRGDTCRPGGLHREPDALATPAARSHPAASRMFGDT